MSTTALTIPQLPQQWKVFADSLSGKQKLLLGATAVLTLLALAFFVKMAQAPDMKVLFTGMSAADAQKIGADLEAKRISHDVSSDGTVRVPADQIDALRLQYASNPATQSGRMGFDLFDKPNWAGSEFSEHVNYQRALEGELEHTISTIAEVQSARVHLVLPKESLFEERERPAKAAVVLKLRSDRLQAGAADAIQSLVASAVEGLSADDVTIIGADDRKLLSRHHSESSGSQEMEDEICRKIIATLEPIVGQGKVKSSVTVERVMSTTERTQETYDPKSAVALAMQRSEEHSGGPATSGVVGTAANVPGKQQASSQADSQTQSSTSENGTYGVNRTVEHSMEPAGRMRRITVAVVLDEPWTEKTENGRTATVRSTRSKEELDRLAALARAAAGIDVSRGDVLEIQSLPFDGDVTDITTAPLSRAEQIARQTERWHVPIRYAAVLVLFLLIYSFVIRPIKREAIKGLQSAQRALNNKNAQSEIAIAEQRDDGAKERSLRAELLEQIAAKPDNATQLLTTWIRQGEA